MRKLLALFAVGLALVASPASADWTGKDAAGSTITFFNAGTCTSVVCVPVSALVNAAGATAYGTAGTSNAAVISVQGIASGTALPISGTVTATPTGTQAVSAASASYSSGAFASGAFASGSIGSGAMVDLGAIADAAATAGSTGSVSAKLRLATTQLATINTTLGTPFQAGGAVTGTGATGAALSGNPFRVALSDGTNTQNWLAAIALADGVNGNNTGATAMWLWNGTTYDRARGTVADGMLVEVSNTTALGQAAMAASSPVVIASDQTANALWGHGVTGAAVPANATYVGFNSGGNLTAPSTSTPLPVNNTGPYPIGAVPYTATNTGTTGATTATLAGAASVTTYICGFSIRANATAAATGNATVTGVITATMNFTQWTAPNASGLGITEMIFSPCIPASAANTSIAVVSAAPGTGGVVSVSAWGYKL